MAFRDPKIVLILLQLAAFWSVGRWYFLRLSTSNDETWGILALLAIAALTLKNRQENFNVSNLGFITASILFYAVSFPFLPPLLRAVIGVTSLTFTISVWFFGKKFHFGIWSLFLLCLPSIASMQFFLGFPLRILVGEATAFLLKLNGLVVFREGVCLHFGEQLIWIDAPCSGIKMLWTGFFLTSLLVTIYSFNFKKVVFAFASAFGIILLGNIFRAVGLFYLEAEIVKMPAFAHEAIGVSAFILTCIGIVAAILNIRTRSGSDLASFENELIVSRVAIAPRSYLVFMSVCLLAFLVPFFVGGKEVVKTNQTANFPTTFEGKPLQALSLTERENFYLNEFPGEIKRFSDGNREIIIRHVTNATRKLHLSTDCFSAIGYAIKPLPIKIDESRQKWACFNANKNEESLNVCERIFTENGESWTDVSAWYWSAISSENKDYWAVTVAETAN
jgi:exosortase/archaeosortase family protein